MSTPSPPPAIPASVGSPFQLPVFRAVWFANLASNFGGLVQSVGAAWLMTSMTQSPQYVALVQASTVLPIVLLSMIAGATADNYDRRRVMLAAQVFMLIASIALTVFAWMDWLNPLLLLGFTFLIGCGSAFNNPAWQASVGDMVPRAILPGAIAYNAMGFNIARSLGPAIGGAIVAAAGAAAAFLTNVISYLALIVVLSRWRPERTPRTLARERIGAAIAAGLRYVAMSPGIRIVLLRALLFGLAASALPAMMPLVARDLIGGGPLVFGLLLGSFGVGAVVGALASGRLRARLSTEHLVRTAAGAVATGAALTALSPTLLLTMPALVMAGAGWVLTLSTFNVTIQLSVPRWVLARSLATYQMAAFGGMVAGSSLFGFVAEYQGVAIALLAAAGTQFLGSVVIGLVRPLPPREDLDLAPLDRWVEPATAVPVESRSGPIVIIIEYRVAPASLPAFMSAIAERRRICRRDGARRWTLSRDLAEPDLWVERFHVATWLDYVRTSQRRTQADARIGERIRATLRDGSDPKVRRLLEREPDMARGATGPSSHELGPPMTDPSGTS